MNASASSLDREVEVQSEIRKVRKFGRTARAVCAAIFAFGLIGSLGTLLVSVLGVNFPGPDGVTAQAATLQLRLWVSLTSAVVAGVGLASVYQLYRLFGNLAVGAIYTPENVRRVRNAGLLGLLWAAVAIAIPFGSNALVSIGFLDSMDGYRSLLVFPSLSQTVSSVISAGLVLLASWIMDVGLYEKDHADALRRDADLVI